MQDPLITRIGRALYGDQWKGPMSRETGIRKDTLDGWAQGRGEPPMGVYGKLLALAEPRLSEMEQTVMDLRTMLERAR